jgi:hypothetical protein
VQVIKKQLPEKNEPKTSPRDQNYTNENQSVIGISSDIFEIAKGLRSHNNRPVSLQSIMQFVDQRIYNESDILDAAHFLCDIGYFKRVPGSEFLYDVNS